jgi:type II secretory pathway component GspD/PulD (secretin)
MITAPAEFVAEFEKILSQIDVAPSQVKISILVTEISKDKLSELGLQEMGYSFGANQQFNENWQAITGLVSGALTIQTDIFGTIVAKIAALEEQRQAKIKADPWIIAKENKPARLFVGQREIIIVQPEGAVATIQTVDVGIGLDIIVRVVGENEIEVSFTPSVSYFSNGRTTRTLSTKRNEMSTTLIIRSGQTVAVSGLTVEGESQSSSGLPLLSRIPLLRYLFGVRSESSEQRELVIFLSVEKL